MQLIAQLTLVLAGPVAAGRVGWATKLRTQHVTVAHDKDTFYGDKKCPCVGYNDVGGTAIVQTSKDKTATYPADLGASCAAWDNDRNNVYCKEGQDPGKGNGWCVQQWCYVDPCNCDIPTLPKTSSYFPGATYQAKPIYYSYATCGGKDMYTKEHHKTSCVLQESAADCMSLEKCSWNGKTCGGKEIMGQCAQKMHGFTWGMASCRCVGIADMPGTTKVTIGEDKFATYPGDAGATCEAWDNGRHPDCAEGKKDKPKWCFQAWCYVDPCSCRMEVPPKTSAYLPDADFQGRPIYYSYETCGNGDYWTSEHHTAACVNQKSSESCSKLDKCSWTGSECLGKELVGVCEMKQASKPVKSAAWAAAPLAAAALLVTLQA